MYEVLRIVQKFCQEKEETTINLKMIEIICFTLKTLAEYKGDFYSWIDCLEEISVISIDITACSKEETICCVNNCIVSNLLKILIDHHKNLPDEIMENV